MTAQHLVGLAHEALSLRNTGAKLGLTFFNFSGVALTPPGAFIWRRHEVPNALDLN